MDDVYTRAWEFLCRYGAETLGVIGRNPVVVPAEPPEENKKQRKAMQNIAKAKLDSA